jgi:glycerophosphoryl diester phosphodiesterase
MKILSHRGFWRTLDEKNTQEAIERSVRSGFGTETDVRDRAGRLILSHDPPVGNEMAWQNVIDAFAGQGLTLAVNVKADGLSALLSDAFAGTGIDWFAFDMSGPETYRYAKAGIPFFARHSDIEPEPILYDQAAGIWLDAFESIWFDSQTIERHVARGKRVCIVSPELHGRPHEALWTWLKVAQLPDQVMLCTDLPEEAQAVFC